VSWHYTAEKVKARIEELGGARIRGRHALEALTVTQGDGTAGGMVAAGGTYRAAEETVTLRGTVTVPEAWAGQRIFLGLEFGGAETLVSLDGTPTQAIDRQHHDLLLADPAEGGRTYQLDLAAYTGTVDAQNRGGWSGAGDASVTEDYVLVTLKTAELQWIDRDTEGLFYDLSVAFESAQTMDVNSRQHVIIMAVLDSATNLLDFSHGTHDAVFYASVTKTRDYVQAELYQKYHADPDFSPTLWATGHAHIDTAWLWRLAHTHKKIERTFTTHLALMEQYPEYHFSASQPQQYAYLKEDNPVVYARVKEAVARGQWEPVGGMWVESDCNVVSGESLVRQFLYGQRFFEQEFGKRTNVVWLPDVFGYSAAFPQIIKKAGMKYFMTIKIYWSQINKPPYQTFEWEGLDGTTVLTHFSPLGDYNAMMTPEQTQRNWTEYKQKSLNDSALYIYGFGDGGGGPTRPMVERAERLADFPGMPRVKMTTNEAFFEDLERQVAGDPMLPRWVGELYLEYHRGTYTSQARNKRFNRQSEILLQTAEQLASLALLTAGAAYPQARINKAWELTLLNQFHDIIPGSSIHAVYEDSDKDYQTILGLGTDAAGEALGVLADRIPASAGNVVLYNPLSWPRSDIAELPRDLNLPGQHVTDFDGTERTLVHLNALPALGYDTLKSETLPLMGDSHGDSGLSASPETLENQFFKVTLDVHGEIASLYDKRSQREVMDQSSYCKGNALLTFEDKPMTYDAWDIDIFYQDKMTPVQALDSIEVIEQGPLRATVEVQRSFGVGSTLTQRISLYRDIPRIDFATDADWQERQTLLKVAFPVTVQSARATYDVQFGNLERPTHWNTSWDWARFEVCGHKWADLSEGDYGVSLLSDSKYGWDIKGNVMRLTLLKGGVYPDPDADRGRHRFAYALYPHAGDWRQAETVQRSYEFNVPVLAARTRLEDVPEGSALPASLSLAAPDVPNLIIETIKKAEDDDALIVRFFETYGQRGPASLTFARPVQSAVEVNLMEEETPETQAQTLSVAGSRVAFTYTPYEIKTLKVRL
jgi:alpha-mannosidase